MNARVDHLLLEALALAPEERSIVALSLLDSLQGDGVWHFGAAQWCAGSRRTDSLSEP